MPLAWFAPDSGRVSEAHAATPSYRFAELDLWLSTLFYVEEMYVDPARLDWERLLVASTEAVERYVPEARFKRFESEGLLEAELGQAREVWRVGPVTSAESLARVMFLVSLFLEQHLDAKSLPEASGLGALEGVEFAMTNGMLGTLDPHSRLLTPDETRELDQENRGAFDGLGVVLSEARGGLEIVDVLEGGPAEQAGVRAGDVLLRLDGENALGMSLDQAVESLRGERGEPIDLVLERQGHAEPLSVTVIRDRIALHPVHVELLEGGVAYVRIESFHQDVDAELASELQRMRRKTVGEVSGIILDLRGNPGGFLNQAVAVADRFLQEGTIVTQVDRNGRVLARNDARWTGQEWEGALVVLVDERSASASEIVAGALRGHEAALLMGRRTFGKGTVQNLYPIRDDVKLKLTISRYLTPGEESIQSVGISTDIELFPVRVTPLEGQPPIVELYAHERSRRESDLMGHLERREHVYEPSLFKFDFVDPSQEEARGGQMEAPVWLARDLILATHGPTRTELLLAARQVLPRHASRERGAVESQLSEWGLDWREGEPGGHLDIALNWDPPPPLVPGAWHTLEVTITNDGEQDAHQVLAWLEDPVGVVRSPDFPVGRVPAGGVGRWEQPVRVPEGLSDQQVPVTVHLRRAQQEPGQPEVHTVRVAPRRLPRWAWDLRVDDAGGARPGVIEPGERVEVSVEIRNEGLGWAGEPFAMLRSRAGRHVELTTATLRPGMARNHAGVPCVANEENEAECRPQMGPGESWSGVFDLRVAGDAPEGAVLDLVLAMGDDRAYDWLAAVGEGFEGLSDTRDSVRLRVGQAVPAPRSEHLPTIRLDRVSPSVSESHRVRVSGRASDPEGLAHVAVYIDGDKVFLKDNSPHPELQVPFTAEALVDEGRHVLVVVATDVAGHQSTVSRAVWIEPSQELGRASQD